MKIIYMYKWLQRNDPLTFVGGRILLCMTLKIPIERGKKACMIILSEFVIFNDPMFVELKAHVDKM